MFKRFSNKKSFAVFILSFIAAGILTYGFGDKIEMVLWKLFPSEKLMLAKATDVSQKSENSYSFQDIKASIIAGIDAGKEIELRNDGISASSSGKEIMVGETVVIARNQDFTNQAYVIIDRMRLAPLMLILLIFLGLSIIFGRSRGITSILGLGVSIAVVLGFIIPGILAGQNAIFFAFTGALIIAPVSMILTHGFNKQTWIAILGTVLTLGIACSLSIAFVSAAKLIGIQNEQLFYVKTPNNIPLDLADLLIAAIIIGTLGVLEDITIAQSVTVYELKRSDPGLGMAELYKKGSSIGREHIGSLINTLVLAYAGTSLPALLYIVSQKDNLPFWLVLNGEQLADEIVRTVVGGSALILAVPITTILAAFFIGKKAG